MEIVSFFLGAQVYINLKRFLAQICVALSIILKLSSMLIPFFKRHKANSLPGYRQQCRNKNCNAAKGFRKKSFSVFFCRAKKASNFSRLANNFTISIEALLCCQKVSRKMSFCVFKAFYVVYPTGLFNEKDNTDKASNIPRFVNNVAISM